MKSVNHPYLIKYIDEFTATELKTSSQFLVMEFAEGDKETIDFLLGIKIGSELLDITIEGQG